MGYSTDFTGHVTVEPPLNGDEISYLAAFANSRRFARHSGPYTTDSDEYRGPDTIDYNQDAEGQHSLWCDWEPTPDGSRIQWNGTEKFHYADRWMAYLINTFLKPGAALEAELANPVPGRVYPSALCEFTFDHVVNGRIEAQGEDVDDRWALIVVDNAVFIEPYPTLAERLDTDPTLSGAVEALRSAGVTVAQYAGLIGEDW